MALVNYASALNELATEIGALAEAKGFWDMDSVGDMGLIPLKLSLVHDEVSEALRVHRNEYDDTNEDGVSRMTEMQEEDFAEELADVIIRTLDLAGYYDLDIGNIIISKMERNASRAYRHGKRY